MKKKILVIIAIKLLVLLIFGFGGWWYYSNYIKKAELTAPVQAVALNSMTTIEQEA